MKSGKRILLFALCMVPILAIVVFVVPWDTPETSEPQEIVSLCEGKVEGISKAGIFVVKIVPGRSFKEAVKASGLESFDRFGTITRGAFSDSVEDTVEVRLKFKRFNRSLSVDSVRILVAEDELRLATFSEFLALFQRYCVQDLAVVDVDEGERQLDIAIVALGSSWEWCGDSYSVYARSKLEWALDVSKYPPDLECPERDWFLVAEL